MSKIMCFPDTGVGNEEMAYEENRDVPNCSECIYKHNLSVVAPCFDCNGYNDTGRNYFKD